MAESDKTGTDESVSPEFLKKLESISKKKQTTRPPAIPEAGASDDDLLKDFDSIPTSVAAQGAASPPPRAETAAPAGGGAAAAGGEELAPEFLKKLEAAAKRKSAGGAPAPAQASGGAAPAARPAPAGRPAGGAAPAEEAPPPEFLRKLEAGKAKGASKEERRLDPNDADYGIEKAMELMRQLPIDDRNVELMMKVVRSTLESFGVSIERIVADAGRKQDNIQKRIRVLQEEVGELEDELRKRTESIDDLQRAFEEINMVMTRLSM